MQQKQKARGALFLGILLISVYPVLVKTLGDLAAVSAFYRMLISATILSPILFIRHLHWPRGPMLWGSIACGVLFGLDVYCWNLAIALSSATQGTLLTNLSPIFVGILAFLFLPNKPRFNFWIGSLVAIVGMVIFIGWEVFADLAFDTAFLLGLTSALLYACYITLSKFVITRTSLWPYMLINNLAASMLLGFVNYQNHEPFSGFSSKEWSLLIIGGLFCQFLAWYLISYATKYLRATTVSLSLLSQTIFAALLASLILQEYLSLEAMVGGIIMLMGIGLTFKEKPLIQFKRNAQSRSSNS